MKASLKILITIRRENTNQSASDRRKLESKIASIKKSISYFELTTSLLKQYKIIAPELYNEIDSIKDSKGRLVDVYIKFIPQETTEVQVLGTTYFGQRIDDKDASLSSYGEHTVSIKIWVVNKALLVLSHEFGHVKYQVPNLASYAEYYRKQYGSAVNLNNIGHDPDDPSGESSGKFEKRFQKEYSNYLKVSNEKFQNPLVLIDKIQKNLSKDI